MFFSIYMWTPLVCKYEHESMCKSVYLRACINMITNFSVCMSVCVCMCKCVCESVFVFFSAINYPNTMKNYIFCNRISIVDYNVVTFKLY